MKKLLFILILAVFLINISNISAFFWKDHIYWTTEGFKSVSSPTTTMCRPYLAETVDSVLGTDAGVIHYGTEKGIKSYIGLHVRNSYLTCLDIAGDDIRKKCRCVGNALHIIQDSFSHLEKGIVPKYLRKYYGLNAFYHMVIERDYEKNHFKLDSVKNSPSVQKGQVEFYNERTLNTFFDEFGGYEEDLQMFSDMAGIDMKQDFVIIRRGYLGEGGFFNAVYKNKLKLPWWFWASTLIPLILGGFFVFIALKYGITNWRFVLLIEGLILVFVSLFILYVIFFTGETWKITNFIIEIPPKFGYMKVSQTDIVEYDRLVQEATNRFLETSDLLVDDASGLSYVDRNGVFHEGALNRAQRGALYFVFPALLILFIFINYLLIKKSIKR